ncbi:DUF2269 domain-containing protein [Acetobacter sp. AN02]|uniref:DUF2269 family protein n=1 Tax=Acetobacter sp. AN02 TaxID=2894186 RepID=UPI00243462C8|nr:DUF2269 domain-containing protein [Acetobacter sp. AN02]MDG6094495.1 DUF2269 domain-containing protein [Acetobacter sp. AN02]
MDRRPCLHADESRLMPDLLLLCHILSASVLFASGLVTALVLVLTVYDGNIPLIARASDRVVRADWILTLPSGITQFITGLWLAWRMDALTAGWVALSVLLYGLAGLCWLPVVRYQIRMAGLARQAAAQNGTLPSEFMRLYRKWFLLGWPAFIALIIVFWLMAARPIL